MSDSRKIATIGMFDGVHTGHQYLIEQLKHEGDNLNLETLVISFYQHPLAIIASKCAPPMLSTPNEKTIEIARLGINDCILLDFNKELQHLTAKEFMMFIHEKYAVDALLIGFNNRFGSDKLQNITDYRKIGESIGVKVIQAKELPNVSSSIIRIFLLEKKIQQANQLLGRFYFIEGTVVGGKQIGRTLGFPTANILPSDATKLIPLIGVYAARVTIDNDSQHKAMVNIGLRPTIDNNNTSASIEANIFDFSDNIYGKTIKVEFLDYIRDEQKFNSLKQLREQINLDKISALKIYNSVVNK